MKRLGQKDVERVEDARRGRVFKDIQRRLSQLSTEELATVLSDDYRLDEPDLSRTQLIEGCAGCRQAFALAAEHLTHLKEPPAAVLERLGMLLRPVLDRWPEICEIVRQKHQAREVNDDRRG